jgi:uncharacterized protein
MSEYPYSSKEFYAALDREELLGSICTHCGHMVVPAREICPNCKQNGMELKTLSGKGKLAAYTVIFVPPTHMAAAGYSVKEPYCVGIVELDEGPRVSAQILDVDLDAPEKIKIGKNLTMTTIERGEEDQRQKYLAFR